MDFSEVSLLALHHATSLARACGATLDILHAWQPPLAGAGRLVVDTDPEPRPLQEWVRAEAKTEMDAFLARWGAQDDLQVSGRLERGNPAEIITAVAAAESFDLIVIGMNGRGGLARTLLGSVADRVVRSAPCPVLTIRRSHCRAPDAR